MKNDIRNREDIKLIVDAFYEKVKKDDEIAFFFSEIIAVEWENICLSCTISGKMYFFM